MTRLHLAGRRVAVLGVTGFLGRWTAVSLAKRGAQVFAAARDPDRAASILRAYGADVRVALVDLLHDEAMERWLSEVRSTVVFNLAGYGVDPAERDESAAYRLNVDLVARLVAWCAEHRDATWGGARLVHAGSAQEYGQAGGDLRESGPTRPSTLYGRSKLAGTEVLVERSRRENVSSVCTRLFTVYGPGEHAARLLPSLIAASACDAPIALTAGQQSRDFGYVEDVVERLVRLAEFAAEPGTIVNVASGRLHTVRDFTSTAADRLGIASERLRFGEIPTRDDEMRHDAVTVARLHAMTGQSLPDDLGASLDRAIAMHRQLGAAVFPS